ncbi:MAG: TetR/AcrR family transcriptional regulator [Mycobacterium sp.]
MTDAATVRRSTKYYDIVAAAQVLFGEVGYDKTGVREIAGRAHIALGTLYSQFPDGKIGVLSAAMTERVERLVDHISRSERNEPVEAFLDRVRRLNSEIVRDPFLRKLFLEQGEAYEPRLREHGRELIDSFTSLAVAELTRLTESGEAACTDPEAVAVLMRTATIGWIAAHASGTANVDHDRLLDVLIAAVRALLRPIDTDPEHPERTPSRTS